MFYRKIWPEVSAEIETLFQESSKSIELKRGDLLYRQGDGPQGIYFIQSGLIGLSLIGASSGKEHFVRFFRAGHFCGHRSLFANEGHHATAVALEKGIVTFLPKSVIQKAFQDFPELYRGIVAVLAKELRRAEVKHVMVLENQVLARTAQSLVYLKELHPEHNWTRQEIASFCASTTSTIIRALGSLEERGLISQQGREIMIKDREALLSISENEQV